MLKLKAPLIIAGATCILSMLIGLISGVRFLNILMRGLIAGIGSGGFVLCARIILERFIPDLFIASTETPSDTVETADVSSGSNINITLEDDLNVPAAVTADGNTETGGTPSSAKSQTETQSGEAISAAPASNASDSGNIREDTGSSDSAVLSFDDNSQDDNGGLSDLPNMGLFIDDDFGESIDDSLQTDNSGFSMTGIQTDGNDSKVMAQAIRTVFATED